MNEPKDQSQITEGQNTSSGEPRDATTARDANTRSPIFAAPQHQGEVGQLGRYRVLKELGRGGMGAVYLGHDDSLDRKLALKVMLPEFATNSTARERFLREARSAAKVKSDHVVTIHDVGEANGIPFIAMEYLLGAPLDKYLQKKGELSLEHAIRVTCETAIGLSAVHALGLVHRDIKPGNIWLEAPKGRVKLLDFGLARGASDDVQITGSGAVMGTVAYMSPEQGRGQKIDARSDLFSLGVMLYRLTTGKMPFVGETAMVVLTSLAIDDPISPRQHNPRIPVAVEAVILKLLAKNPAERFQTAEQVAQALLDATEVSTELPVVVAVPIQPLLVGAQTQNVWENVLDSESVPVPLETPSEATENDSPPVAKPKRAVPERKVSKVPLYVAGAVFVLACAVLAAVLLWPKKPQDEVAQNDDNKKNIKQPDKVPNDKKNDPLPKVDADASHMKAVEWILSIGGTAEVTVNGMQREIAMRADLPKEPFVLTGVQIRNNEKVTDEGLGNLKDCHTIRAINLSNTPITDAGLAHLKDLKNLELLWASATGITDAGLVHLQNAKQLTELNLAQTKVTDAGLAYFKNCPKLNTLIVYTTGLTDKGFATFKGSTTIMYLQLGNTPVTNEGLANFRDNKNLTFLHLTDTKIGDVGISYFKDCTTLKGLVLFNTDVTDAVIPHLREFRNLTELNVQKTKITANGIAELRKLLPNCRIEHDGGVIEPKPQQNLAKNSIGMEFVVIPKGKAWLGGGREIGAGGNFFAGTRDVTLARDFYMSKYEVTQEEWKAVMGNDPGRFTRTGELKNEIKDIPDAELKRFPVENVSWDDCQEFLAKLNEKEKDSGWKYRLPTDAEWEYACRGGPIPKDDSKYDFYFDKPTVGLDDKLANFGYKNQPKRPRPVGSYAANPLGLHDMHGNVAEWVQDNIKNPLQPRLRIYRGGDWNSKNPKNCAADSWDGTNTNVRAPSIGFRVVREPADGVLERKAAEYILNAGGKVRVRTKADGAREYTTVQDLPKEPFSVISIELTGNKFTAEGLAVCRECLTLTSLNLSGENITDECLAHFANCGPLTQLTIRSPKITDAGLVHFAKQASLSRLHLALSKNITDAGIAHFKDCTQLADVSFSITQITNAGLAHMKKWDKLTFLFLVNTAITDDGLVHLAHMTKLSQVALNGTKVTEVGATKLADQLGCQVEWNDGTIKAKPKPQVGVDDTETAKYILGVGGRVRAKTATETVPVLKLEELPAGPIAVTYLELINKDLSDEGWQKLAALHSLTQINIQGATFTDAIAAQFSSLEMEEIRVSGTKIGDRGLAALAAGKKLRRADVGNTAISDTGLKAFAACPELIDLTLTKTAITDAGLSHLKDAKKLIWLHLNDTAITDDGLKHLEGLQALRQLTLRGTKVTEPALKALKLKFHPDCQIEWDNGKVKP